MNETIKTSLQAAALFDYFEKLPPSHRKEYLDWIGEAKKEETQQKRIMKMVKMLQAKQKQ
jgi:uncharacterized protein YdeI (YjbR/CyaY-like superfamily)